MASSPSPSSLDSTSPNATQARLPTLSPEFIAQHYPKEASLLHVILLNRHGERAPAKHRFTSISPKDWNFCEHSGQLEADFLKAAGYFIPAPATNKYAGGKLKQDAWGGMMFRKNASATQPAKDTSALDTQKATCVPSQLTDIGRKKLTALGAHMRALYVDALGFLPATPRPGITGGPTDDIRLRTTAFNRAFASLQHILGGLYPSLPANTPLFRVYARSPRIENMYPNPVCKSLSQLFERANELSYDNFASEHASLRQDMLKIPALRAHFDKEDNHNIMHFATAAWDTLISMHSHGLPLPKEIDDAFIARVSQVAAIEHLNAAVKPLALTRVEIGNFAHELIGNIVHAVETDRGALSGKQPSPKMGVYSGHDTTIGPLLLALSDESTGAMMRMPAGFGWPPYASSVRIELLKDTKTPCPATLPHWAGKLTDFSTDMAAALPESRVRPVNVPSSLYHWPPGRSGTAGSLNPRATRDYYVRVWYNDRTIQLPACRDPGAHHTKLGPAVCTLDGFFKQIARFAASDAEAHRECNLVSSIE